MADTARVEAKEYKKTRCERIEPVRDCSLGRKESAIRADERKRTCTLCSRTAPGYGYGGMASVHEGTAAADVAQRGMTTCEVPNGY